MPLARVTPAGDSVEVGGRRLGGFGRVAALNAAGPYYGGTIRRAAARRAAGRRPQRQRRRGATRCRWSWSARPTAGCSWPIPTATARSRASGRCTTTSWAARASAGPAKGGHPPRDRRGQLRRGRPARPGSISSSTPAGTAPTSPASPRGTSCTACRASTAWRPARSCSASRSRTARRAASRPPAACSGRWTTPSRSPRPRHLPLVLNLSFGVGNELEGQARIDGIVDSVLAAHPDVVLAISAGNDGPGLSTIGFPGQRRAAPSASAPRCPSSFLPPGPNGAPPPRPARVLQLARRRGRAAGRGDPGRGLQHGAAAGTPATRSSRAPAWPRRTPPASPRCSCRPPARRSGPSPPGDVRQALMVTAQPTAGRHRSSTRAAASPTSTAPGAGSRRRLAVAEVQRARRRPGDATARGASRGSRRGSPTPCSASSCVRPAGRRRPRRTRSGATRPGSPPRRASRSRARARRVRAQGRPEARSPRPGVARRDGHGVGRRHARRPRLPAGRHRGRRGAGGRRHPDAPRAASRCPPAARCAPSSRPTAAARSCSASRPTARAERALSFLHEPDGMPFRDEGARSARLRPADAPSTRPTRATWCRRVRVGRRGAARARRSRAPRCR